MTTSLEIVSFFFLINKIHSTELWHGIHEQGMLDLIKINTHDFNQYKVTKNI